MPNRADEVSAGGLVVRRGADGFEALIAEQVDRNTGRRTVRLPKGKVDAGEMIMPSPSKDFRAYLDRLHDGAKQTLRSYFDQLIP